MATGKVGRLCYSIFAGSWWAAEETTRQFFSFFGRVKTKREGQSADADNR